MKNVFKILSLTVALGALIFTTSCGKDDSPIVIGGGDDGGSFAVADGLYFAGISSSDTTVINAGILSATQVEGPDFGTIDRAGHFTGYMYLTAGSYFFVEIEDQNAVKGYGGSSVNMTSEVGGELASYSLVSTAENGAAVSLSEDGLYHVIFDTKTSEGILAKIDSWGIVGSGVYKNACESDGFDADVDLTLGTSDATGSEWSIENILLKNGKVKVRYNDAWKIERRSTVDPNDPYNEANGYVALTNFGGTAAALEAGGSDFDIPDGNGKYTVGLAISNNGEISISFTKTGESEDCAFVATDYQWGVLGSAIDQDDADQDGTPDGWQNADQNLFYKGNVEGVDTWLGVMTLEGTDGAFKFRANDAWTVNIGGTLAADGTESTLDLSGSDIANPGAGMYFVTITTADQGVTWKATMVQNGWGVIGAATPTGWDSDNDMTANGTTSGVATYTSTLSMTAGEYKFRANDDWAFNLGTDDASSNLKADGGNFNITEAGTYVIELSFDGDTYTSTAIKQN